MPAEALREPIAVPQVGSPGSSRSGAPLGATGRNLEVEPQTNAEPGHRIQGGPRSRVDSGVIQPAERRTDAGSYARRRCPDRSGVRI